MPLIMLVLYLFVMFLVATCGKDDVQRSSPSKEQTVGAQKKANSISDEASEAAVSNVLICENDDGYKWRNTSREARLALCKDFARRTGKHDWNYYFEAIDEFYATSNSHLLSEQIAAVAAMVTAIPSEKELDARVRRAYLKGEISTRELEIYSYCHSRWDYHERRDGGYVPESHDELVFSEAARKFGISKAKVKEAYFKVGNISAGL